MAKERVIIGLCFILFITACIQQDKSAGKAYEFIKFQEPAQGTDACAYYTYLYKMTEAYRSVCANDCFQKRITYACNTYMPEYARLSARYKALSVSTCAKTPAKVNVASPVVKTCQWPSIPMSLFNRHFTFLPLRHQLNHHNQQ